jgi:hydrogenase maturation protease
MFSVNGVVEVNKTLVIGFGNKMRRDDGAGCVAAEMIAAAHPGVDWLSLAQLTPELAQVITQYERVLFLDASVEVRHVKVSEMLPQAGRQLLASHILSPQHILNLAVELYGECPRQTTLVQFPACDLDFGWELSPCMQKMVEQFVSIFPVAHSLSCWNGRMFLK